MPIVGFYTSRIVAGEDSAAAVIAATALVLAEWQHGKYAASYRGRLPTLDAEEVSQVGFVKRFFRKTRGYTFYLEERLG